MTTVAARVPLSEEYLARSSVAAVTLGVVFLPAVLYLTAFGSALSTMGLVVGLGVLLVFITALAAASPVVCVCTIGGVVLWQNTALGLLARAFGVKVPYYAVEIKTLFIFTVAAYAVITFGPELAKILPLRRMAPLFVVVIGALALSPTVSAIAYLRNFTTVITLPIIGAWLTLRLGWAASRIVLVQMAKVSLIVLSVGTIAERLVGAGPWRVGLNAAGIPSLSGVSTSTTYFVLTLDRSGSFAIDPVLCSFLVAGSLVTILLLTDRRRYGWSVVGVILLLSTAGKGAAVMVVIALLLTRFPAFVRWIQRRPELGLIAMWAGFMVGGLVYVALALSPGFAFGLVATPASYLKGGNSSVFHIAGFILAVYRAVLHPLGGGLGSGGNLAAQFASGAGDGSGGSSAQTGRDTALGAMLFQLGALGLIVFVLAGGAVVRAVRQRPELAMIAIPLFAAWWAGWVYQEEISAPAEAFSVLIAVGALLATRPDDTILPPHDRYTPPSRMNDRKR